VYGPPPPVVPDADAGGPYTATEDAPVVLSAGASGLAADETPLAEWDLDADGVFGDATGLNPEVTFADAGTVDVRVRITPSVGSAVVSAVSTVTVVAAPPALVAAPPQLVVAGDATDFALAGIDDPGTGGHTATVTWGDGASGAATVTAASGGEGPAARGTHTYATPGDVTVTVRVCDTAPPAPADTCAEASFAVTVLAAPLPNAAPVATDLSLATDIGVPVLAPLAGSDADGNPLTFGLADPPAHGDLLATPDGSFHYLPDAGFAGIDTFTYRADDGWATSAPATVTVQVGVVRPIAVDDILEITGSPTAAVTTEIPVTDLLANDHDPDARQIDFAGAYADDGVHLAIERLDAPLLPTVLRLIPAAGFAGDTTFTYGISAGPGTFTTAQVRVRVISPVPGAPTGVAAAAAGSTATFTWSAPSWTGSSAIAGYTATLSPGGRTCTTSGALSCPVTALADAPYTVTVTAHNAAWTSVASSPPVPFRIDTTPPIAKAPVVSFGTGATIGSSTVPVHVSWSGTDTGGSGIARFDVGLAKNGGTTYATQALASPTATGADASLGVSSRTTWRFRVRSVDGAGNVSAWVYGPIFRVLRTQESSSAVRFSGKWSTASGASASGGKYRIGSRPPAGVSYTFTGRAVAWVAYRGATPGRAKVYLDGVYRATVDLRASPAQWRRLVFASSWTKSAKHTIKIVCLATPGRSGINVDAFVVLK
ncbi:MAG: Ig-like domain-containing protein, partial [Chloroflexota bacterium]